LPTDARLAVQGRRRRGWGTRRKERTKEAGKKNRQRKPRTVTVPWEMRDSALAIARCPS